MNRERLNLLFRKENLDVLISLSYQTRLWLTEFESSSGILFLEPTQNYLFVDGRYFEDATLKAKNVEVGIFLGFKGLLHNFINKQNKQYHRIGIEANYLTIAEFNQLKTLFPKAKFIEINAQELRIIKSQVEIEKMQMATKISLMALEELMPEIKDGVTEKHLDARLNYLMRKHGAQKNSFDSIVVSGANGALPHGKPSSKKIRNGELLTIDFGAYYQGFASDITRTFAVGELIDPKLIEIKKILETAQKLGIKGVKPGATTNEIDKICRDYITKAGYDKYFVHSTGHGLGIDVHELPNVTSSEIFNVKLEPGMVITVEPGIYIPNVGGIRVEDDILVTEKGHHVLSKL